MPRISKTRLELGRQAKAEAEPKPEVPEVTELLDLLLKEEQ
jgi:hypothetical protein